MLIKKLEDGRFQVGEKIVNTHEEAVKLGGIDESANQWRVRQKSPGQFDKYVTKALGKGISLVLGVKGGKTETQSVRFDKEHYPDKASVESWIKDHPEYHMNEGIEETSIEMSEHDADIKLGGPGSGRYPVGSGDNDSGGSSDDSKENEEVKGTGGQKEYKIKVGSYYNKFDDAQRKAFMKAVISDMDKYGSTDKNEKRGFLTKAKDKFKNDIAEYHVNKGMVTLKNGEKHAMSSAGWQKLSEDTSDHIRFSTELPLEGDFSWIQILREVDLDYPGPKGKRRVKVTEQTIDNMIKNFNEGVRGVDLDIDYEHKEDKKYGKDAAGWFGALEKRYELNEKGKKIATLWMKPKSWTPEAQEAIRSKVKKYFSVEFDDWTDPESKKTFKDVLFGGALTNRPYVKHLSPVTLSESGKIKAKEKTMDPELLKTLKLSEDATEADVAAAVSKLSGDNKKLSEDNKKLKEENDGYKEKYFAEQKAKVLEAAKDVIAPAIIADPESRFSKMLSEGRFDDAMYVIEAAGKGFKEKKKLNDDEDEDDMEGSRPWEEMDGKKKDAMIKKSLAEKKLGMEKYAEEDALLKKKYNEAFLAKKAAAKKEEK